MINVRTRDFKGNLTAFQTPRHGKMAISYRDGKTPDLADIVLLLGATLCILLATWLGIVVMLAMLSS